MVNLSLVEALQDYTQQFSQDLVEHAMFGTESLEHCTVVDGVKGSIVLTDLEIGKVSKRANLAFDPLPNVVKYRPRRIYTSKADTDLEINPKVFAKTYLEGMRAKGQNGKDIPFEGQVMAGIMMSIANDIENAIWQAEETQNATPRDPLDKLFNGFIKIAKNLRAAGHTPIPVAGGAYTIDNFLSWLDNAMQLFGADASRNGVEMFSSRKNLLIYINAYKKYNNYQMPETLRYENGVVYAAMLPSGMGWLYARPGFGASNLVIGTPKGNLAYATDDTADSQTLKVVETIKTTQFTTQYAIGTEFRRVDEDYLILNDLN